MMGKAAKPSEEKSYEASGEVKFKPPSTFVPPDDKQPGDTFEFTGTARIEEDGQLCLTSMDGVPLKEVEADEEIVEEEAAAPPSLRDAVQAQGAAGLGHTMM